MPGRYSSPSAGLGQGSEFVVRLLTSSQPSVGINRPAQAAGAQPVPTAPNASRRIIIVDDNVDAAESLRMILALEGHEVRLAHDGPGALQAAEDFYPDVILLDIGLPRMEGYEVARRLREQPKMEKVLLLALTGYGQEDDRRRSQEAGFNAHLVKPVDFDALRAALAHFDSLLQSPASP